MLQATTSGQTQSSTSQLPKEDKVVVASSSTGLQGGAGGVGNGSTNGSYGNGEVERDRDTDDEIRMDGLRAKRRKLVDEGYSSQEADIIQSRQLGLQLSLSLDTAFTLYPPPPTSFTSYKDVVDRLLPYHVWQVHDEELANHDRGPSKEKAREEWERNDAASLINRVRGVRERLASARRKEDDRPAPLPTTISLIHTSTSQLRDEVNNLHYALRTSRIAYDTLESEARRRNERLIRERAEKERQERVADETRKRAAAAAAEAQRAAAASAAARGRGTARGRPRGRGRGGTRESVGSHMESAREVVVPASNGAKPTRAAAKAINGEGSSSTPNGSPAARGTASSGGTPSKSSLTTFPISVSLIPQFLTLGLIKLPNHPGPADPPGKIIRTTEDKKTVTIELALGRCTKEQMAKMAQLMGITPGQQKDEGVGKHGT